MTQARGHVEALVMTIQGAFLKDPHLALTAAQAPQRFGADEITCDAVLRALVDAHVLAKTNAGTYVRLFPSPVSTPGGRGSRPSMPTTRHGGHQPHYPTAHHTAA